jgi:D-3-phosphoglycerate dehydrogenase
MDEVFKQSDIVSLHIPLTDETKYLVDTEFINRFEKNIYLINTSRGSVLRTSDLVLSLREGKVLGACLDVLEYEGLSFENVVLPDDFKNLISLRNVVLSPHIAGWTHESGYKMAVTLAKKIASLNL